MEEYVICKDSAPASSIIVLSRYLFHRKLVIKGVLYTKVLDMNLMPINNHVKFKINFHQD